VAPRRRREIFPKSPRGLFKTPRRLLRKKNVWIVALKSRLGPQPGGNNFTPRVKDFKTSGGFPGKPPGVFFWKNLPVLTLHTGVSKRLAEKRVTPGKMPPPV